MQRELKFLSFIVGGALISVSAHAACGGGGYQSATVPAVHEVKHETYQESKSYVAHNTKLEGLQRDVEKAQTKLDNCEGDCDKERRKLEKAKAKLAEKT